MTPEEKERAKVNASSMLGAGIRKVGAPIVAGLAGTAADTVSLVTRAFERVGNNVIAGFRGEQPDTSEFVMNPYTRLAMGAALEPPVQSVNSAAPVTSGIRPAAAAAPGNPLSKPSPLTPPTTAAKTAPTSASTNAVNTGGGTAPQNGNFLYPEDQARMERVGGIRQMLQSPNPDIAYSMMRDEKTGKNVVRETINGSGNNSAPALKTPFVSAKAFAQRTGWDKDGNPIYSTGADEMAAANAGIADYNNALLKGYQDRNIAFTSEQGGIPRDQASAAYDNARALEVPLEGQSSRGFRANSQKKTDLIGKYVAIDVPGEPDQYGMPTTRKVLVNPVTEEIFDPTAGQSKPALLKAALGSLSADNRSAVEKHFEGRNDATHEEVMEYIKTLNQ